MYAPSAAVLIDLASMRKLAEQPPRVRQLLHLVQAEVVRQRYSAVTIPDVVIAEAVWGDRTRWPKRWRRDVKKLVSTLPKDLVEHTEWRPVSVVQQHGERVVRKRQNMCPDRCPLHGTDTAHRHVVVFAAEMLLGLLEHHRIDALGILGRPSRQYDFCNPSDNDAAEAISAAWREGRLAYLHGPALIYGPAAWTGLSGTELSVWQAVFRELTRHAKSSRPDRARVMRHANCPLVSDEPHVVFAGNFKTKEQAGSRGFRIIGPTNKGWSKKTGIEIPRAERPLSIDNRPVAQDFLHALAGLESKFSLTAAGRLGEAWLGCKAMQKLANSRSPAEWTRLMDARLRVFAPHDYLDRIQAYFRQQGGFAPETEQLPLAVRINASSLTKKEIAEAAGITPSALSEFLSGRRPWPDRVRKRWKRSWRAPNERKNSAKVDRARGSNSAKADRTEGRIQQNRITSPQETSKNRCRWCDFSLLL